MAHRAREGRARRDRLRRRRATTFSLCTQAYVLGSGAATLAAQLDVSRSALMLTLLPHALLELVALFLPLAAWMLASRREAWNELLAATAVTTAIAVPMLILAASLEVFVWPRLLRARLAACR